MGSRFNNIKANLRTYLRKRGAKIDVKRKTIRVDIDSLNRVELDKLRELERWGYAVNKAETAPPEKLDFEFSNEWDSFVSFADEILEQYGN